jgi:Putative beta-barrel porin 2
VFSTKTPLIAFACALSSALCAAQTPADVRSDAQVHLGPIYLTPRFALKEFGVDSNVFNNAEQKRDFTFTFAPRADVWLPFGRRALLTTRVGTDVVYYQRYGSERSINPDVRLRTDFFLGHVTPFAEAGYLRTRQRPNFEIDARSLREERSLRAGVNVRVSPKVSVEAAADYIPVTFATGASFNDVNLQETLNRTTQTRGVVARYTLTPLTTVILRAESAKDRFEFSPLRNADSIKILPGVEFQPRALISGSAHVGFRKFSPSSDSLEPFAGVVASSSLSYTLRGSTKFTITADRDLTYSYERVQPYFVVDGYGLTVRRQIVGSFDATGGMQRQKYSYRELLLPDATPADLDRVDITRTWFGSIGYRVTRTMRAGFGTMYRERESNSARLRDYEGFRLITTVDYEF